MLRRCLIVKYVKGIKTTEKTLFINIKTLYSSNICNC